MATGIVTATVAATTAAMVIVLLTNGMAIAMSESSLFNPAVLGVISIEVIVIAIYIGWRTYQEDPQFAFLRKVALALASLGGTNFQGTNLTNADFSQANLKNTRFNNATPICTCWQHAKHLKSARLNGTILADRDVRELLVACEGQGQQFAEKDLHGAYLAGVNLSGIDFREVNLVNANLSQATITGAKLYGTACEDWVIDDIKCGYVYWDEDGKERTPKDRDFRPGEFEELYKQLPNFEYAFEHGITLIDIGIIDQIVNDIKDLHPEWELKLDSFHSRGQPHANFTIREKDLIAQAFQQIKTNYEATLNRLKGQYEETNLLLSRFMKELTNRPQLVLNGDIIVGDKNIGRDNIEISGQAQVNQLSTGNGCTDASDSTE